MGFIDIFSSKTDKEAEPERGLAYDPKLINTLIQHHKSLLQMFTEITALAGEGNFAKIEKRLEDFARLLRGHLLSEDVKLYVYLARMLAGDSEQLQMMRDMHRDMRRIGSLVNEFLRKYSVSNWTDAMRQDFPNDLHSTGLVLTQRIQMEENVLYPLYMSPEAYKSSVA